MYEAVMIRKRENLHSGVYIKKFDNLKELAEYIISPSNIGRLYRCRGLTKKECCILYNKILGISKKGC